MDAYGVLGVPKNADESAIRKAYRRLSLQYHPDKNPSGEEKFKEVSEAYSILSDPQKRKMYDVHGPCFEQSGMNASRGQGPGFSMEDMGEVFGSFFGGMNGGIPGIHVNFGNNHVSQQSKQTKHNITLPLKDFYTGKKIKRVVSRMKRCDKCDGRGGDKIHEKKCIPCGGNGFNVSQSRGGFSIFQGRSKCQACGGSGTNKRIENPCSNCKASGRVTERVIIEPCLKPGDKAGTKCIFQGLGNYCPGKPLGDIIITITPEPCEFKRRGNDLHIDRGISLKQCLIGFSMDIVHLDGRIVNISVPRGRVTSPGTIVKIPGEGIPRNHGALFVALSVDFPQNLDEKSVNAIENHL